jgi:hypothetical protein
VVRAVRDGAVCMANGFHSKILHKKASLAVLSDEGNASLFDAADHAAIRDCIPWTRVVAERRTVHEGRPVDLVPFIHEAKDRMVLKPNDDYGGKGITLGWTVDVHAWEAAVQAALAAPHIVQEKVEIPSEPFPSWVDGALQVTDRMLDTAPFVTNGAYMEGILTPFDEAAQCHCWWRRTVPMPVVQTETLTWPQPHDRRRGRVPDHRSRHPGAAVVHHADPRGRTTDPGTGQARAAPVHRRGGTVCRTPQEVKAASSCDAGDGSRPGGLKIAAAGTHPFSTGPSRRSRSSTGTSGPRKRCSSWRSSC